MARISPFWSLLILVALITSACQPITAAPAQVEVVTESVVVDEVGPSTATDPAQAQAEDEFRAVVLEREQAYYDEDYEHFVSFYADDVISLDPGMPEIVGKENVAAGIQALWSENDIRGQFTLKRIWVSGDYATRYGEWDEVVTPAGDGKPVHQIGRCFVGWQKINGEWKVVSSFVNFIQEPTEMP